MMPDRDRPRPQRRLAGETNQTRVPGVPTTPFTCTFERHGRFPPDGARRESYDTAMSSATTVNGICHHDCPDSCGWTVTVDNSGPQRVAVKMRGNPDHPYSYGELCPKVNRFLDRVYSPDRVLYPLRRTGPKGSGEFEQITWDDALDEIGTRLNAIIAEHGGEAIMPFSDAGNQSVLATQGISSRFFHHIGATRLLRNICGPTVGAGVRMTNGTGLGGDPLAARALEADPAVGHQHQAHQPSPVAGDREGPCQRRQGRRDRPDPHAHRRRLRPVHPAAARHRHRDDAGDDARHHPRRSASTSAWVAEHTLGFDELAGIGRGLDASVGRRDVRRPSRRDRGAGPPVRHHPPGRDPHPDRRRAPRERCDVLPHARLPAGAHRCLARARRRPVPQRRFVAGRARRRRRARSPRPARRARRSARST